MKLGHAWMLSRAPEGTNVGGKGNNNLCKLLMMDCALLGGNGRRNVMFECVFLCFFLFIYYLQFRY